MKADAWPVLECSNCRKACVIRLCYLIASGGAEYLWQRDCRCKRGTMQERAGATALAPVREKEGD